MNNASVKNLQPTNRRHVPVVDRKFVDKIMAERKYKRFEIGALPKWEVYLSFAFWIGNSLYACYLVYVASTRYVYEMYGGFFEPGWSALGSPRKDNSNYEWKVFSQGLYTTLPCFLIHSFAYRLINDHVLRDRPDQCKIVMFFVWIVLHLRIYGWLPVTVAACHGFIMLITCRTFRSSGKNLLIVWFVACALLSTLAMDIYGDMEDDKLYNMAVFIAYKLLQYISYCYNEDEQEVPIPFWTSLYNMYSYAIYLPYSFTLIVPYKEYCRQIKGRSSVALDYISIGWLSLRVAFWTLFNDFVLHYFYMNLIMLDSALLDRLDPATLCAVGYTAGQYFHTKYMSIFGINTVFARLDGMQPPWPPICISRVALYSRMWRYFDRGLYSFLREHIFIPIAYPSFDLPRRIVATFTCFAFVWLWHGMSWAFLCWVIMNFVEILLENLASEIAQWPKVADFIACRVSPLARRRFISVMSIVAVAWGILAIFFFLGGYFSGMVFLRRLFVVDFLSYHFFYLLTLGYFFGNCCSELELFFMKK